LVESQLPQPPCWHSWPDEHCWQAEPFTPHCVALVLVTHWFCEQQPLQPENVSQTHAPWEQRSPLPQAAPPSQLQVPPVLHESATVLLLLQPVHDPPSWPQWFTEVG
jgi:hypothetical protein